MQKGGVELLAPWHLTTAIATGAIAWMLLMSGDEVVGHGAACLGLVAFGQIRVGRIDGYRDMHKLLRDEAQEAA